jgi:ABC-type glycerol-3-phosphate transport system substrate-binding protein
MVLSRRDLLLSGLAMGIAGTAAGMARAASFAEWEAGLKGKPGREIRILAISHPASDAMKALTPAFEAATGIKVIWETVGSGEIMSKQLLAQTARDSSYDVYMVRGTALAEYEAKRMLAELGDLLKDKAATPDDYDFEDIHVAYRQGIGTAKGKTLGIPVGGETFFLSYRKDLFEKYGRAAPRTMDELLETARFFQSKEPGLYGISMRAETGRTLALSWELFTPAFGANIIDQKTWEVGVDSPETLQSLEYLLALLANAPPDIETYSWDAAVSAFASGKTAMWFDATSLQPWLTDPTKSKIVGKIAYVAPPEGPKGRFGPVGGWSLGLPANSRNKEAGWAFIAWMTSKQKAQDVIAKGGVPARVSTLTSPEFIAQDPDLARALKDSLDAAGNLLAIGRNWVPQTAEANKIQQTAGFYAGQALLKKMTPKEALAAAKPELEQIAARIRKSI